MFCTKCGKNIGNDAVFCQYCGTRQTGAPIYAVPVQRRFVGSRTDKKIAGVCAGVANYLDLDTNMVRLVWLLCVLLGGTGLLAYVIAWIVMPLEPLYLEASPTYTNSTGAQAS
jgi:phage shock protein C